ncbi:uncharacterized protein LOC110610068 [Manihot esculenta]|uniref:uncharacterized protein LOC110610068 n=1 Tax=Manihot esculenta TaxID=3983 RepID=UPI000B5D6CC9|nr:uncharacterized protein LOC110610068 [Manihot esculenta]
MKTNNNPFSSLVVLRDSETHVEHNATPLVVQDFRPVLGKKKLWDSKGKGQVVSTVTREETPNIALDSYVRSNGPAVQSSVLKIRGVSSGSEGSSRKAAAQDDHVVVQGNNRTNQSKTWVVSNPKLGAASSNFLRAFKEYNRIYKPKIFCLVEPRISGHSADNVCKQLGYDNWVRVETFGFSGGIWILWSETFFKLTLVSTNPQFVTCNVLLDNGDSWLVSFVYASPDISLRRRLWHSVLGFNGSEKSWLLLGDFNSFTSENEQTGYVNVHNIGASDFQRWIFDNSLIDLGFEGTSFTWSEDDINSSYKAARLDRCLCTEIWRMTFSRATIIHAPKLHFNHCPIFMNCFGVTNSFVRRFHFQAAWTAHKDFVDVVFRGWKQNTSLFHNLKSTKGSLSQWNRSEFGNIFHNKQRLIRRIDGVQKSLAIRRTRGLVKLEFNLRRQFQDVLKQEELYWFQQSREEWIVSDSSQLKELASGYYQELYSKDLAVDCSHFVRPDGPALSSSQWLLLDRPFSHDEVYDALRLMSPYKAPGPNGLQAVFFQKSWSAVGSQVSAFIIEVLGGREFPDEVNETVLTLIPKIVCPEFISQFRPISLCNVLYKLVTKVLINRLKDVLSSLIGLEQSSFVPGRQIIDNIVVFQEVLHTMRTFKRSGSFMAIKIDLEKAYDRLNWDFIQWVLGSYHFSDAWISNIMNCIRTSSMSVLWNGEKLESFKSTRGVRQGDPMSSYLFVMCIEQLSRMFKQLVRQCRWKSIPISSNGPMISHLMFADDMVLFAEASVEQSDLILSCLDDFAKASGQKVNLAKSSLYLSPFVDSDLASLLSSRSGIPLTADLRKYLGVPSIHGRISVSTYGSILDKMRGKLDGWKARALKSWTTNSALLPISLCNEMEKICKTFIWHGKDMKPAVHLINWDTMSLPKRLGGLGIRNMRQMNQALLGKLCWRAYKNPQALWVRCLFNKYESGVVVDVNNGMHTRFWLDDWLPVGPLWNFALKPLIELNMQAGSGPTDRSLKYVGWKPPETGWVVVNFDGSALLSVGRASCAVLAWDSGWKKIEVQTDSQLALDLLTDRGA